jgi:hypothetical protein
VRGACPWISSSMETSHTGKNLPPRLIFLDN